LITKKRERGIPYPHKTPQLTSEEAAAVTSLGTPSNVLTALQYAPLKRTAKHGVPVCSLQLRTYSVHNVELMADFALRAAYYLNLPASGPVPLPKIVERWTVPKANFIFKKSQENFERITLRRLITIFDGHPETVRIWLGVLQKYQYHGVGMKANVWEWESLDAGKKLDKEIDQAATALEGVWKGYGSRKEMVLGEKVREILRSPKFGGSLEVARREREAENERIDAVYQKQKQEDKEIAEQRYDEIYKTPTFRLDDPVEMASRKVTSEAAEKSGHIEKLTSEMDADDWDKTIETSIEEYEDGSLAMRAKKGDMLLFEKSEGTETTRRQLDELIDQEEEGENPLAVDEGKAADEVFEQDQKDSIEGMKLGRKKGVKKGKR
jgi:small subunit ribosomal protein S10